VLGGTALAGIGLWYALGSGRGATPIERSGDDAEQAPVAEDLAGSAAERSRLEAGDPDEELAASGADPGDVARAFVTRLRDFELTERRRIEAALLDVRGDAAPRLDVDAELLADLRVATGGERLPLAALAAHRVENASDARFHALLLATFAFHEHGDATIDARLLADALGRLADLTQTQSADARAAETRALELARATGEVLAARRATAPVVELVTALALLTNSVAWRGHEDEIRGAVRHVIAHHPGPFDADQRRSLGEALGLLRLDTRRAAWHALLVRSRDAHTLDVLRTLAGTGLGAVGDGLRRPTEAERDVLLRALAADGAAPVELPPEERVTPLPLDLPPEDRSPAEQAAADAAGRLAERLADRVHALEGLVHLGAGVARHATAPSVDPSRSTRAELLEALSRYGAAEGLRGLCELVPLFRDGDGLAPELAQALRRSLAWYVVDPRLRGDLAQALVDVDAAGAAQVVPAAWRAAR
jgi:hypothetical protein